MHAELAAARHLGDQLFMKDRAGNVSSSQAKCEYHTWPEMTSGGQDELV